MRAVRAVAASPGEVFLAALVLAPLVFVRATQGLAWAPALLLSLGVALLHLAGVPLAPLGIVSGSGRWVLVLQVLGVRASLGLPTGRVLAALLSAPACVGLLVGLLGGSFRRAVGGGEPGRACAAGRHWRIR